MDDDDPKALNVLLMYLYWLESTVVELDLDLAVWVSVLKIADKYNHPLLMEQVGDAFLMHRTEMDLQPRELLSAIEAIQDMQDSGLVHDFRGLLLESLIEVGFNSQALLMPQVCIPPWVRDVFERRPDTAWSIMKALADKSYNVLKK